jgi:hypothetical protein
MAISHDHRGFATPAFGGTARAFVLGRDAPASRWIGARVTTLFSRGERALPEDRPPLAESLAKLVLWMVAGIAVASAAFVLGAALVVRIYTGAFG